MLADSASGTCPSQLGIRPVLSTAVNQSRAIYRPDTPTSGSAAPTCLSPNRPHPHLQVLPILSACWQRDVPVRLLHYRWEGLVATVHAEGEDRRVTCTSPTASLLRVWGGHLQGQEVHYEYAAASGPHLDGRYRMLGHRRLEGRCTQHVCQSGRWRPTLRPGLLSQGAKPGRGSVEQQYNPAT